MPLERHHRPFGHADTRGPKLEAAVAKTYTLGGGMKVANAVLKTLVQLGGPGGSTAVGPAPGPQNRPPPPTPGNPPAANRRPRPVGPPGPAGWGGDVRA